MKALLDTNILVALKAQGEEPSDLSGLQAPQVSALSWSEMVMGLHRAKDVPTYRARSRRLVELQRVFGDGLAFDRDCLDAYDAVLERVVRRRGEVRARRFDRMIAATALAQHIPLATRNVQDFRELEGLLEVVEL
ncbi:PIN domain-containing protein [Nesterenkonia ebinurensis]|uniref:PIN domain-containing protein n=1 Tax=Nesterenkonia ebinurensis TaxID=2608252 RepID=UPI00168A8948|nr:PIN domain-containing protein [Nesterenkonia ebinurensis]